MGTTENTPAMGYEQARAEVIDWLKLCKISDSKIEKSEDVIESLTEAMQDRRLVIDEKKVEYTLIHELKLDDGSTFLDKVNIKNRINYNAVKPYMKGIKSDDAIGMMHAYACALIGEPMSTFTKLDTRDSGLLRSIASFFF